VIHDRMGIAGVVVEMISVSNFRAKELANLVILTNFDGGREDEEKYFVDRDASNFFPWAHH
jgi:hypothetical protein